MLKSSSVLLVDDDPLTNDLKNACSGNSGSPASTWRPPTASMRWPPCSTSPPWPTPPAQSLVLLDVKMPGMDGMAFVDAYQRLPESRQQAVVIVLHTASRSSIDLARIEALPIAGLVSKPLTKEKLDTILKLHD